MAKLDLTYYNGTDSYSDGDIEDRILELVKKGVTHDNLYGTNLPYPVIYHLSKIRENILNWYPFKEGASVLEIGAGCGAITGVLCDRCSQVTSVDLSKRRSVINYERHQDKENLTILVGNQNDIEFKEPFDYIVLNGVLEYAMSFTQGEKPYQTFLQGIARHLKPDGKLLIAIENRLGLKYMAGAPEDHTDLYFLGLEEYQGNSAVRTFSKEELKNLLKEVGLNETNFYFPYPDYKLPSEIFTEETMLSNGYGKEYFNLNERTLHLYQEQKLAKTLSREGIMGYLANSFLVEAGSTINSDVIYAKLSADRWEKFRIKTTIFQGKSSKRVRKTALSGEANLHIKRMYELGEKPVPCGDGKVKNLQGTLIESDEFGQMAVEYPYVTAKNLDNIIEEKLQVGDVHGIYDTIRNFYVSYCRKQETVPYQTEAFKKVFGTYDGGRYPVVYGANADLICDNIFLEDGNYTVIDSEWIFEFAIPVTFLMWRTINELYTKHRTLIHLISKEEFYGEFFITGEDSSIFWHWSEYFAGQYVGSGRMEQYYKPPIPFSPETYHQAALGTYRLEPQLYVDRGEGFKEENVIRAIANLDESGNFTVQYRLEQPSEIKALRFDPIEGKCCICKVNIKLNDDLIKYNSNCSSRSDSGEIFYSVDPYYNLELPRETWNDIQGADWAAIAITVSGQMHILSMTEVLNHFEKQELGGTLLKGDKRNIFSKIRF